jgi:hypothetical protein
MHRYLINGRGQLGDGIYRLFGNLDGDFVIYHTWNVTDKSKNAQHKEYLKLKNALRNHEEKKLFVFISTTSQVNDYYVGYKRAAEDLVMKLPRWNIIRLPQLIGRGVCDGFKTNKLKPFGTMNLCSVDDASSFVLSKIFAKEENKIHEKKGTRLEAKLVYDLIRYGAQ